MKKLLFILPLCALLFFAFKSPTQNSTSTIVVKVRHDFEAEDRVKVKLFKTKEDYEKRQNPIVEGETSSNGEVEFNNLELRAYYVYAEKGELTSGDQNPVSPKPDKKIKVLVVID